MATPVTSWTGLLVVATLLGGCGSALGYRTVDGESFRLRGRNAATLGSYGFKDEGGLHSFEQHGVPETVVDYKNTEGVEIINQHNELSTEKLAAAAGAAYESTIGGSTGDARVVVMNLNSALVVVERIPIKTLIDLYRASTDTFGGKPLLEHLRADPRMRIINAVIREVDGVTLTGVEMKVEGKLDPGIVAALASTALSTGAPSVQGEIDYSSTNARTYIGGRVVGYQMCHCIFDPATHELIGLKIDRPIISDELPATWQAESLDAGVSRDRARE